MSDDTTPSSVILEPSQCRFTATKSSSLELWGWTEGRSYVLAYLRSDWIFSLSSLTRDAGRAVSASGVGSSWTACSPSAYFVGCASTLVGRCERGAYVIQIVSQSASQPVSQSGSQAAERRGEATISPRNFETNVYNRVVETARTAYLLVIHRVIHYAIYLRRKRRSTRGREKNSSIWRVHVDTAIEIHLTGSQGASPIVSLLVPASLSPSGWRGRCG